MKIPILRNPKTLEMYVLRIEQSLVGRASVSWARDLARATPVTPGWSAQQSPAAVTAVTMQTRRCHCHLHSCFNGAMLKVKKLDVEGFPEPSVGPFMCSIVYCSPAPYSKCALFKTPTSNTESSK